jgi:hypothetical protein
MIGSADAVVKQRFFDAFINAWDLNELGQFTPRTDADDDFLLWQKFTHALEESGRCLTTADTEAARDFVHHYWANGDPIGLEALKQYPKTDGPILVKYSKTGFLQEMLAYGRIRISPASEYQAQIHNYAIRDSELERPTVIPTFTERLSGKTEILFQGQCLRFGTGDLEIPLRTSNYYVYCLSESVYYRLPTDFEAEAALIIKDPKRFTQAVRRAFRNVRKGYRPVAGPVRYYDPYTDHKIVAELPQMAKHLRYSYQREHRIAFLPEHQGVHPDGPFFLEIGPMMDYADLVVF